MYERLSQIHTKSSNSGCSGIHDQINFFCGRQALSFCSHRDDPQFIKESLLKLTKVNIGNVLVYICFRVLSAEENLKNISW